MKLAIIGGGLTGCVVALDAADPGHSVVVYDREADIFSRAAAANEGKIHLGYVYSADASFNTAERLIEDALFCSILARWISAQAFDSCLYDTFHRCFRCGVAIGSLLH